MAQKNPAKNKKAPSLPLARWERVAGGRLLTNDAGCHALLGEKDFARVMAGGITKKDPLFKRLAAAGFVRESMDFEGLAAKWRTLNAHLDQGPGLHILVLTLRCNHKCLYCQSSAAGEGAKKTDMDRRTALASVDFAFTSPNPLITIEFQGGEPLLNWDVLKAAVKRAREKAAATGKELKLALVSNFTLMTEEKARFLLENEVSICTSLDGPADLHNKNRIFAGGNSHAATVRWIKYFQEKHARQSQQYRVFKPGALLTVSRQSLPRWKEIIEEYAALGLEDIFVRPLAPIGYARGLWDKIGYTPEEFQEFYGRCLDYILALNRRGTVMREKTAAMMLEKIVNATEPGYLDARCPCGAAIGQIAYNYNGDLFTCDEGRMVGWEGDDIFRVGNVFKDSLRKVLASPAARACVVSSNLEAQPECSRCAYKPYCGVCPVYNYEAQGSLWGNMRSNGRCSLFKGVFAAIFKRLGNARDKKVLESWVAKK